MLDHSTKIYFLQYSHDLSNNIINTRKFYREIYATSYQIQDVEYDD